jgi:arabinose-5-phosphate isomerase
MSTQRQTEVIPFDDFEQLREGRDILRREAQALADLSHRLDADFCTAITLITGCRGTVVVTGMGKAGLIARKITATMASTGTRAQFLHPAEAVHGDIGIVHAGDVVLALSNSGETEELCRLLPLFSRIGVCLIAITAKATSTLARAADVTLLLGHLTEACPFGLAPTTSTTAMLALGDALSLVASRVRGFSRQQFALSHPAGSLGRKLRSIGEVMRSGEQLRVASETATIREVFVSMRKPGRRTGAVMLVDAEGLLSGLFTDSDLVRLLEDRRENQLDRPIAEVMTSAPRSISCEAPLADAIALLSLHRISELPVVDGVGRPAGLIDITDVLALMPDERME